MRLNYEWDLTGFEDEEVRRHFSGFTRNDEYFNING